MRYKIPQWAAAAAVLIVCVVWISQSYSPALAAEDVVAHIMNARTAQWDMIVKNEGSADVKIRVYLDSGHTRQEFETGMVVIVDFKKGQSLGLFADDKLAMTRPSAKMPGSAMKYDHFEKMRKELREAMADADKNVEELGKQQFDGRTLVGFRFKRKTQTITIWADPDTAFPVRIETQLSGATKTTVVMVNYTCNIDLDPSLFSLEIPDGYSVRDENSPIPLIDHQDLIESLRMYCKSSEGEFPAGLDVEATSKYIGYLAERNNTDQVQRSRDEQAQDLLRLYRGFAFATALAADEKWDAHYAGAGVKLGDTGRPIFWYKPADSEKYRVIYADLSAGEVDVAPIVADAVRLAP